MQILPKKLTSARSIAAKLLANKARYQAVEGKVGVPWYVIAAIHERESSANFATHLHNGDPLTARTVNVPAGRPLTGVPPFTWEESAIDALTMKGLAGITDWSIEHIAYECERYNGWGYRQHGVPSAYLWSYSNIYPGGKYIADHVWSANAQDAQCGVMPLAAQLATLDSSIVLGDAPSPQQKDGGQLSTVPPQPPDPWAVIWQRIQQLEQRMTTLVTNGAALGTVPELPAIDVARVQKDLASLGQVLTQLSQIANQLGEVPTAGLPPQVTQAQQIFTRLGQIESALGQAATTLAGQSAAGAVGATAAMPLSPIDKVLGGPTLVGLKTPIAIVAYALVWILQSANVLGTATGDKATMTGSVLTALIAAFGGLGVTAKFDRGFQALSAIAGTLQKLPALLSPLLSSTNAK
jgi:lysozyme family protein